MPGTAVRPAPRLDRGLRTKRRDAIGRALGSDADGDSDANGDADADAQRMSCNHHAVAGTLVDADSQRDHIRSPSRRARQYRHARKQEAQRLLPIPSNRLRQQRKHDGAERAEPDDRSDRRRVAGIVYADLQKGNLRATAPNSSTPAEISPAASMSRPG